MFSRLRDVSYFFIPYLFFLGLGLSFFLYKEHGDFVLLLDSAHTPFLSVFFQYWTYTGDWFFVGIITLVVLYFRYRHGLILGLVLIVQGAISLFLKQVLFEDSPRPKSYFEGKRVLDLIDDVKIQDFNSFPSGHTMAAFALGLFLVLMLKNNKYSFFIFLGVLLTAISRVYLGHHFLIDIIAGSLIGMLVAGILYFLFDKYLNQNLNLHEDQPDRDLFKMDLDLKDMKEE